MRCIGSAGKLLFTAETAETAEEAPFRARFLEPERCVRLTKRLWGNYNCNGLNHNCNFIHVPGGDAAPIALANSENAMGGSKHFVISEIIFAPNVFFPKFSAVPLPLRSLRPLR